MKPILNIGLFWQAILSEQRKVPFFFYQQVEQFKEQRITGKYKSILEV